MLAVMGAPSTSSHAIQSPMPASSAFSPAHLASAFTSKSSTPMSPASTMSSHDSPKPSTAPSSASSASIAPVAPKPQLAIKPVAPNAGVRPLQMAGGMSAASPGGNVMSMTSVVSPMPQSPAAAPSPASVIGKPPMSITSKEWVIPPRPKPGRKPATDTPPTKRKAQNRAAQRAFRERRAARVGELEDQLEDQRLDYDRTERDYQEKIQGLETDVQVLRSRCQYLENLLEKEKATNQAWSAKERQDSTSSIRSNNLHRNSIQNHQQQRQQSQGHILSPAPQKLLQHEHNARGSTSSSISSASGRRVSAQPFSISQIISPPDEDLSCGNCNVNGSCACADEVMAATSALDCGKCTLGTKCACLEESINALSGGGAGIFNANSNAMDLKRPHSTSSPPPTAPEEKKARHNSHNSHNIDLGTEIDFTHMFSRQKPTTTTRTPLPSMPPRHQPAPVVQQPAPRYEIPLKERCGFCSDGTYCVCADSMSMPGVTMTGSLAISTGAVVAQEKTPPPSENDAPMPLEVTATGAIKLSSMAAFRRQQQEKQQQQTQIQIQKPDTSSDTASSAAPRSKCGPGGPGTCAQCLADPVSGLFCRSLAANFERQGSGTPSGGGGCCGGGGASGGCCKDKKNVSSSNGGSTAGAPMPASITNAATAAGMANAANTLSSIKPGSSSSNVSLPSLKQNLSLSCADAYKTLASHRHFDEATDEIGTWLPKLRAAPRHDSSKPATRHPMEVEAASIMSVLKGFDVRFGKCD
ncbi:bzip transcription factor [Ophiostoma piceae UAMH 11346]|uniref:Bzip transcription factor n=1 Tax=Ophiostoma piceae (strain UAMH 11346) TaxID=1262450 RepID=S3C9J8_OPHP1|nr:bzip transcription factor [Ophiostoma piceae UAMH 11346]